MTAKLIVVNRYRDQPLDFGRDERWVHWQTCYRQVAIGMDWDHSKLALSEADQVFFGGEAYRYLLEVICGLHSPIVGETEIYGQFKKLMNEARESETSKELENVLIDLNLKAKRIRHEHLSHIGSQSYGSMLRRVLRGFSDIHIIGSGQLAQELLPWLSKKAESITMHCRSPHKVEHLEEKFGNLSISKIGPHSTYQGAVVLAAPVKADEINRHFQDDAIEILVDLRGESRQDPINIDTPMIDLSEVFSQVEENKKRVQKQADRAFAEIQRLSNEIQVHTCA